MSDTYEETVTKHYEQVAEQHGLSETSTLEDTTTCRKESEAITTALDKLVQQSSRLLEIGCGNGVLLDVLRTRYPTLKLAGRDFSQPMVELAQSRGIANCDVARGDVRSLDFEDETFDLVVGERVVVSLMDRAHQWEAFAEIARPPPRWVLPLHRGLQRRAQLPERSTRRTGTRAEHGGLPQSMVRRTRLPPGSGKALRDDRHPVVC